MNKTINKLLAGVLALGLICSGTAFAKDPVEVSKEAEKVTVTVSTLDSDEETTILVVPQGVTISQAFADTTKIYHMDQAAATSAGVATFSFKYSGEGNLDIYSGYATMSADDAPYEGVLDLSGGTGGSGGADVVYGDVNADEMIDTMDALAVINNFLYGTELDIPDAADVNADEMVDTMDALDIINNFLYGTEFEVNQ